MAILSNGKFYGFLCSVKETGQKLANGAKEYAEDFVSGFAGHGWKLWEYVKGKWKLEVDTIVVRETMLVFEMLISKVRAIIGAQAITQGHGKVKSVRLSEDGAEYLIELEDEDISIVAHDFVRCQTFTGDNSRLYHVEVASVDTETKTLHIPISEFEQDELGNILHSPMAGDELVQFGNSQNKARQSAIYLHADETGQPAMDVMFDLDSKNWEDKVKVRVGGEIPGSNGLRGFYSVNGLIKGVDNDGSVVYEFSPDGTVNIGRGNIRYNPATNKVTLGSGVTLTWDNLDDEVKENLKGEKGEKGESGRDGINGINGQDGKDGLDIVWKGDASTPPADPQKNWVYRDTGDGRTYIYNGTDWALMVADGNDGVDGTNGLPGSDGKDGMKVYITYHDSEEEPAKPVGNGTTGGWHTNATASVVWISQKVAESADSGEWGSPIKIKGNQGEPGQDANLPDWLEDWNGYATELGKEYIVTPKMFSGTKTVKSKGEEVLTGIVQGKDCLISSDGTKRTGIFALVDNEIVFELDPVNEVCNFKGNVIATSGRIGNLKINGNMLGSSDLNSGIEIGNGKEGELGSGRFLRLGGNSNDSLIRIRIDNQIPFNNGHRGINIESYGKDNICLSLLANVGSKYAIHSAGPHLFYQREGESWNAPGTLMAIEADSNGNIINKWGNGFSYISILRAHDNSFVLSHDIGRNDYYISAMASALRSDNQWVSLTSQYHNKSSNSIQIYFKSGSSVSVPKSFNVVFFGRNRFPES